MSKYTNAKYPDKINDLIDNDGNVNGEKVVASGIQVLTEAPIADNPEKDIKFVQLDKEPAKRFNGYYYLIGSGSGSSEGSSGDVKVEAGSIIRIDGRYYVVVSANNDLTDVELATKNDDECPLYRSSPSPDTQQEFIDPKDGSTVKGPLYTNSDFDNYCNDTFFSNLPEDVQAAIIEQEIVHDGYIEDKDNGDITLGQYQTYRYRKMQSVNLGRRKVYGLTFERLLTVFNTTTITKPIKGLRFFSPIDFASDECFATRGSDYCLSSAGSSHYTKHTYPMFTFHVDLTKVKYKN